jgi:hypothetical protein
MWGGSFKGQAMARDFAQISTTIWDSRKVRSLGSDDAARLFYFYLHTNILVNNVGCYVLKFGAAADDLKWNEAKIEKAIDTLSKASLIGFDRAERLVRIIDFLKKFPTGNEKHAIGCVRTALALPDCSEKLQLLKSLLDDANCKTIDGLQKAIDTLSIGYRDTDTDTETERDTDITPDAGASERKRKASPKGLDEEYSHKFLAFWAAYPSRGDARNPKQPAWVAWRKAIERGAAPDEMIAAAERYAKTEAAGTKFIAQAVTWLSQDSWKDAAPVAGIPAAPAEPPPELKGWRLAFWKAEGPTAYKSWIEGADVSRNAEGTVTMVQPTRFRCDHVRNNYADKLLRWMRADDAAVQRVVIDVGKPASVVEKQAAE